MRVIWALLATALSLSATASLSAQQVDVELVFLADSSGSIDAGESASPRHGDDASARP